MAPPEIVKCTQNCYQSGLLRALGSNSMMRKIGTEAKQGKSWFTSHFRTGLPEWGSEINHLHYLYCLISLCISFIYFLNPVYSWICVSSIQPQIFCTSFYNIHHVWIFHGLLRTVGLMFLSDYAFCEQAPCPSHYLLWPQHQHYTWAWHSFSKQFHCKHRCGFLLSCLQEDPLNFLLNAEICSCWGTWLSLGWR